jgi:hypothetical protein
MFEFDSVTLIAALVLSLAFAAPFYYNHKINKKKIALRTHLLHQTAKEKGLVISKFELWRERYIIGLDSTKGRVLYIQYLETPIIADIDLSKVRSMEILERNHEVGKGKEKRKVIDNLELVFYNKNNESFMAIEFYDGELFSDMEGELPLIKEWQTMLKTSLKVSSPVFV